MSLDIFICHYYRRMLQESIDHPSNQVRRGTLPSSAIVKLGAPRRASISTIPGHTEAKLVGNSPDRRITRRYIIFY